MSQQWNFHLIRCKISFTLPFGPMATATQFTLYSKVFPFRFCLGPWFLGPWCMVGVSLWHISYIFLFCVNDSPCRSQITFATWWMCLGSGPLFHFVLVRNAKVFSSHYKYFIMAKESWCVCVFEFRSL